MNGQDQAPKIDSEKLTPKELALLELQRERLRGDWELEKQRAANHGGWVGAAIGALSAVLVAGIANYVRDRQADPKAASTSPTAVTASPSECVNVLAGVQKATSSCESQKGSIQAALLEAQADLSKGGEATAALRKQLVEWEQYGNAMQKTEAATAQKLKEALSRRPDVALGTFQWNASLDACRVRAAKVAVDSGYTRLPTSNEFAGRLEDNVLIVSCTAKAVAVAGKDPDRVEALLGHLLEKLGTQ
jgi:hypothetical protein